MSGACAGRVAIVTGGGRGFGRAHALELARQGAKVVVNDLGTAVDGRPEPSDPGTEVVDEIRLEGGQAIANGEDVADWDGARRLVEAALSTFGRLDVLVNNAGVLRDRMLVNMTAEDWDTVMRVHLRGTFCPTHHAAVHWRSLAKAGTEVDARIINTSSAAGLFGNVGQPNYSAAKAGILGFTIEVAAELARYGVTVNAIAPGGRTRMTEELFPARMHETENGFDVMAPENVAPLVAWLASPDSTGVTGRVFQVFGGTIGVANGWARGPEHVIQRRYEVDEVGPIVRQLLAEAPAPVPALGA